MTMLLLRRVVCVGPYCVLATCSIPNGTSQEDVMLEDVLNAGTSSGRQAVLGRLGVGRTVTIIGERLQQESRSDAQCVPLARLLVEMIPTSGAAVVPLMRRVAFSSPRFRPAFLDVLAEIAPFRPISVDSADIIQLVRGVLEGIEDMSVVTSGELMDLSRVLFAAEISQNVPANKCVNFMSRLDPYSVMVTARVLEIRGTDDQGILYMQGVLDELPIEMLSDRRARAVLMSTLVSIRQELDPVVFEMILQDGFRRDKMKVCGTLRDSNLSGEVKSRVVLHVLDGEDSGLIGEALSVVPYTEASEGLRERVRELGLARDPGIRSVAVTWLGESGVSGSPAGNNNDIKSIVQRLAIPSRRDQAEERLSALGDAAIGPLMKCLLEEPNLGVHIAFMLRKMGRTAKQEVERFVLDCTSNPQPESVYVLGNLLPMLVRNRSDVKRVQASVSDMYRTWGFHSAMMRRQIVRLQTRLLINPDASIEELEAILVDRSQSADQGYGWATPEVGFSPTDIVICAAELLSRFGGRAAHLAVKLDSILESCMEGIETAGGRSLTEETKEQLELAAVVIADTVLTVAPMSVQSARAHETIVVLSRNATKRKAAAIALASGSRRSPDAMRRLIRVLQDRDVGVVAEVVTALGIMFADNEEVQASLRALMHHADRGVRVRARAALRHR